MTHHDIYDWDLGSPPALIEATKDGRGCRPWRR